MPLADHPAVEVEPVKRTHRDDAAVTVSVALLAGYHPAADLVGKCECGIFPAPIFLTAAITGLTALGRINAVKANTDTVNIYSIAVDYRNHAC